MPELLKEGRREKEAEAETKRESSQDEEGIGRRGEKDGSCQQRKEEA